MNKALLSEKAQKIIRNATEQDARDLIFKKSALEGVTSQELVAQIESRLKCISKLPAWYHTNGIYYPPKLSVEQSSSEITAAYKSKLVSGDLIVDITGGMGVDSWHFSRRMKRVIHVEWQQELSEIARHNFDILGAENVQSVHGDGITFLSDLPEPADWIYADPARRHDTKGKVFMLEDYSPEITQILDLIKSKAKRLLLKTAPLLDIDQGLEKLPGTRAIHVLSVKNEVRELLWEIESQSPTKDPEIIASNLSDPNWEFRFTRSEERSCTAKTGPVANFLYEPGSAILKAGGFKILTHRFPLMKLHEHSHLYTADQLVEDFPGKTFEVLEADLFSKAVMKRKYYRITCNVSTRNFPLQPDSIKKQYRITEGGSRQLFFTTNSEGEKMVILAQRL